MSQFRNVCLATLRVSSVDSADTIFVSFVPWLWISEKVCLTFSLCSQITKKKLKFKNLWLLAKYVHKLKQVAYSYLEKQKVKIWIFSLSFLSLTLTLLTWRIWWAPNNASKWQIGCNSAFKRLKVTKLVSLYGF